MPTPPKPYQVIVNEKKSHRTKAELNARKQAEEALSSSAKIKEREEVKQNKIAHKEYLRISKLLKDLDKNDAIYEAVINRYCMIQAECAEIEDRKEFIYNLMDEIRKELKELYEQAGADRAEELTDITNSLCKLANQLGVCDKILQQKRKMLLDIEKENIMTIASALRTIPKKEDKKRNPLLEALNG